MKLKTKLTLGVGLLFLLIVLLSVIGSVYINKLKSDTEKILTANYNSLEFSKNMLLALDNISTDSTVAVADFQKIISSGKESYGIWRKRSHSESESALQQLPERTYLR
jgi:hypothetical protein